MNIDKQFILEQFKHKGFVISGLTALEMQQRLSTKTNHIDLFYLDDLLSAMEILYQISSDKGYILSSNLTDMKSLQVDLYSEQSRETLRVNIKKFPEYGDFTYIDEYRIESDASIFNTLYLDWYRRRYLLSLIGCVYLLKVSKTNLSDDSVMKFKSSIDHKFIENNKHNFPQINYDDLMKNLYTL